MYAIQDPRLLSAFSKTTFCGFKKKEVITDLIKELLNCNVEHSCFWCAELICSGALKECWDTLFYIYGKHISIKNPKMAIYFFSKIKLFKQIINEVDDILNLRNDNNIRELFTEIVSIICFSIKNNGYEPLFPQHHQITNPPYEHYNNFHLHKLKDPPDVIFGLNELYCILTTSEKSSKIDPLTLSTFWIELLIDKGKHLLCESRDSGVGNGDHVTWAIWDIIKMACIFKNNSIKSICALESIYKLKFKNPNKIYKERKYLIFTACDYVINNVDWTIPLVHPQFDNQIKKYIETSNLHYKKILEVYAQNINRVFAENKIKIL
jgi:hypothetical protein